LRTDCAARWRPAGRPRFPYTTLFRSVVVERVQHRGRGDAGLPQRAAEEELPLPRALDRLRRAGKDRPERAAEPLREADRDAVGRSEEHTSELQSRSDLVCRLLLAEHK